MQRTLANVFLGSVVRKYKFRSTMAQSCGIQLRASIKPKVENWDVKAVRNFYLRDDVSRVTTGVTRTVTFQKVKKQCRVLNDTLKKLYMKFKSETQTKKICYAIFCNLRPFWLVFPQASDRNTCGFNGFQTELYWSNTYRKPRKSCWPNHLWFCKQGLYVSSMWPMWTKAHWFFCRG